MHSGVDFDTSCNLLVFLWFRRQILAISGQCSVYTETVFSVSYANQLAGFYMNEELDWNGLMGQW